MKISCIAKKTIVVLLAVTLMVPLLSLKSTAVTAKAYALIEQSSGRVILSTNENNKMPMASTTKIMTGLLAVESGRLDETFTVPADAIRVEGSSMGLRADEKITLRELTYGLMLESGNDAANTIAVCVGGSIPDFVKMMNAKAVALGLYNTHYCNPSGLGDKEHYTSAKDLAELAAFAMNNSEFSKIVGTKKIRVSYDGKKNGRLLSNHNRLLQSYDGAMGVKTGFTKKSGRCLVTCAKRNGVEIICATLNDPDDWQDHTKLLDEGFKLLKPTKVLNTTEQVNANVVGGTANTVATTTANEVEVSLKDGEFSKVTQSVELERFYYAPIKKGQKLGTVVYKVDGVTVAKSDITAAQDIPFKEKQNPANFFTKLWNDISNFFKNLFK